ncbi:hypothetical protein Syun_021885 [Stephania yunnanensis]|uniref:Uncharacterized protein n=1 Tax=Stephania yunnanensis TaxID=152371 RepID=A0AAP0NQ42_9MAGN
MASRSRNRQNLSFDVLNASEEQEQEQEQEISISLTRSSSEPIRQHHHNGTIILEDLIAPSSPSHSDKPTRRKRKKKGSKKNRHHNNNNNNNNNVIHEDFIDGVESEFQIYRAETVVVCEAASTVTEAEAVAEAERSPRSVHRVLDVGERSQYSELRQRSVNGGAAVSADEEVEWRRVRKVEIVRSRRISDKFGPMRRRIGLSFRNWSLWSHWIGGN